MLDLKWVQQRTTGGTGSASTITNGRDDDDIIDVAGAGDIGTITVDIIDDDQVTVTATKPINHF